MKFMKVTATFRSGLQSSELKAAPPCRLRLAVNYPRVALKLVPSHERPNLFGCD